MTKERRKAKRVKVGLRVRWEGEKEKSEGRLVDLSVSGCFIQTSERVVTEREEIVLEIFPPRQGFIFLCAEVIHCKADGFAVHFTQADERDRLALEWLLKAELYRAEKNAPAVAQNTAAPAARRTTKPVRPAGRIPPSDYAPERCAWCQGTGKRGSTVRCDVCAGKGGVLVSQPPRLCVACNGAGYPPLAASDHPCPDCLGGGWQNIWRP